MTQPPPVPSDDPSSVDDPPPTVLQQVSRRLGRESKVTLPDTESEHGVSPLIDSRAPDAGLAPGGRGNYQVMGEIARGGMGVILKSHDTDLGRDVAMKVLLPEHAQRDMVLQRFVEEAQIGGQLQHPGIVPVYEMGLMPDQRPYFTMKLVKGRTLAKLLSERTSIEDGRARFLGIFEKVCETLAYAHARNVLHRDLKPANIMVGAFGEVQVVDWGLAKVLREGGNDDERAAQAAMKTEVSIIETVRSSGSSSGGSESMVGSIMGTPAYMPPEQALGETELLDERADVFALGAILCEMLTGRPPYVGKRDEVVRNAARARLDDAKARLAACGADEEIIGLSLECMAPARAARPRSAEQVLERIHAWMAHQDERMQRAQIRAAEAAIQARAERKARKLTLALAATILVAVLGGGAFWMHQERQAADARTALVAQVDGHLEQAGALRGEGDFAAAFAACDAAAAVVDAGDGGADLASRVSQARALVEAARTQQFEHDAAAAARLAFLAELEDAILDEGLDVSNADVQRSRQESFAATFEGFGLDPTSGTEDLSARLKALDAPLLVGQALDEYARVHRVFQWDSPVARRLTALARQIDPDPIRNAMRDAIEAEDRSVLSELIVSKEIPSWPPNTVAMLQLAIRSLQMGLDTLPMLRACQRNHPDNPIINQLLAGRLQFRNGSSSTQADFQEALRYQAAALATRPDNAIVGARMSWTLAELGRMDEAIAILAATRRHSPAAMWVTNIGANNMLEALEPAERPAAQRALFRAFADALPESTADANNAAWFDTAWPDSTDAELTEALALLEQIVALEPDDDASQNSLGLAYIRQGRWADGLPHLQRSMELAGTPHMADMLGVAIALWHLDQRIVAREWVYQARAMRDEGNDPDLDLELSVFWVMADEIMPEG
jgi:serine/threonine-protein kinase